MNDLNAKLFRARIEARRNPQGRADFSTPAETAPDGPEGARPIEAPSPLDIDRLREGIARRRAPEPRREAIRSVAARVRAQTEGAGAHVLIDAADLDMLLTYIEGLNK